MQIRIPLEFGTSTPGSKYCFLLCSVQFEKKSCQFLAQNSWAAIVCAVGIIPRWCSITRKLCTWYCCVLFDLISAFCWISVAYIPISFKVASLALELLCKCYSVSALMADDMGKIDKPCVNISGYAARDGVSKSVTELTTTRQSLNQTVEGVSTAWCHHNILEPGPRLNKKDRLSRYGDSHVKDKTAGRTSYL